MLIWSLILANSSQGKENKQTNRRSWKYFLWSVDFCLKSPVFTSLHKLPYLSIYLSISIYLSVFLSIYHLSSAFKFILYKEQVETADIWKLNGSSCIYLSETKLIQNHYYSHCVIELITVNDLLENQVTGSGFQQSLLQPARDLQAPL